MALPCIMQGQAKKSNFDTLHASFHKPLCPKPRRIREFIIYLTSLQSFVANYRKLCVEG